MQVTAEHPNASEVELKIEVPAEKVTETIDRVYDEFAKHTNVPGFRKGKAPRTMLERFVSPESVRRRAVDLMVPDAYQQAIEQEKIEPYADPDVEIVQFETEQPFIFKAKVPLPPKIELGEYKGIEIERTKVAITDEDVDAQLKYLQESHATSEKVEDRGVQTGDIAVAEIASAIEGEEMGQPRRSLIQVGQNIPGFDDEIIGMKPGEQRTFTINYPDDFEQEELKGKNVVFQFKLESLSERHVPELNDEFAKTLNFDNVEALKEDVRKRMIQSAEENADREVERKIVDEVVNRSTVTFPDVLVEHEMGHDLHDIQHRLERQNLTIEQYLKQTGKTQEEFIGELRQAAQERLRNGLVLGELAGAENLIVSDEEVDAEIDRMASEEKTTRETVEAALEARGGRSMLRNSLLQKRIMDFLKSVSVIK